MKGLLDNKSEIKKKIREEALARRDRIPSAIRKAKSRLISDKLYSLDAFKRASSVLLYASYKTEAETSVIMNACLEMGKKVVLPKVNEQTRSLTKHEVSGDHHIAEGYMGIPEPLTDPCCTVEEIDFIVVPGVAFDATGARIGYGGGYYDRLLPRVKGFRQIAALAYEEQIFDNVPSEPHDVKMDIIITDNRIIDCGKEYG